MGAFHDFRVRHNQFVKKLPEFITQSVQDSEKQLLDMNREQLKVEHMTSKDQPIRPPYSKFTANLKGFSTPDLYNTGDLFRSLTLEAKEKSYQIMGHTFYTKKLIDKYGKDIFGVAISKQPAAKNITTKELAIWYKSEVFK